MGIIYNNNVEETELYQAYGLTVYGKINNYDWTIYPDKPLEKVLISFLITDAEGNNVFNILLENRCIFWTNFERTIDNFLWWIAEDKPLEHIIEKQMFQSLCAADSVFNYRIENRKFKQRTEREERERQEKAQIEYQGKIDSIKEFCYKKRIHPVFYG